MRRGEKTGQAMEAVTEKAAPASSPSSHAAETGEPLSDVLSQLTEGVATLTEDGVIVSWNPSAAHMTGYTISEANRIGFWALFDPPDTMMHLVQQARRGEPVDDRLILRRANGESIPIDVRSFPLRHLGHTAGRTVVVLRDLSELEALHAQLLQNERLSMLGRLAGAVSHEIRNPLTAIFLQADILEDELLHENGGDKRQILRSVGVIKEEVTRLHELVQQYLSLARLSNLQREPVDLGTYLDAFADEVHDQLLVRNIVLNVEHHASLGQVNLHPNSFRRVLLNLINNAVDAMPEGGVITLQGHRTSQTVCLSITDTGCGIPEQQMPMLFSPLHTTKPEGTGLGLYLAREIVAAHEGEMTVESQPGVGTTFSMTLPADPEAQPGYMSDKG